MKIVTFNIQYSLGRDGGYDLARQMERVRDADVICLQEVERNWRRTDMVDQPQLIEALLPDRYWVFGAGLDVDAGGKDGGRVVNRRRQFGNMTLSRWPIAQSRNVVLPKHDTGAAFNSLTSALDTIIAAPHGPIRVVNLHLSHATAAERLEQIAELSRILARSAAEGSAWNGWDADAEHWQCNDPLPAVPGDVLVLGDFNAEPHSEEYAKLTTPTAVGGLGLIDAWTACGHARESGVTFFRDEDQSAFTDQRIDYCFLTAGASTALAGCRIDEATRVSDHQPVWVEFCS